MDYNNLDVVKEVINLFEEEKKIDEQLIKLHFKMAYLLNDFKTPEVYKSLGFKTFKDFYENYFSEYIAYSSFDAICKLGKFLEMDNYGEIHSFLAEAETVVDETGNLCYKIKDYDYAKLMQLRCFSCEELLLMHYQGIINMDMTLEEIKLIKKGGK